MKRRLSRRNVLAGLATGPLFARPARAQTYPSKPIQLLIGYAAGGTMDTQGRVFANLLSADLGQPVVVVNRPGASAATANAQLKTAPQDGHTLMFADTTDLTFVPLVTDVPFKFDDFTMIGGLALGQPALVVRGDSPIRSFEDFLTEARKRSLAYVTQSQLDRLIIQVVARRVGISLRVVPAQGGAAMVPMILGGQADIAYSGGIHVQYKDSGQMRVVTALTEERLKAYPDVPTLREAGHPYAAETRRILVGPGGLPAAIVARLEAVVRKAVADREFVDLTENRLQFPISYLSADQLTAKARSQRDGFVELIRVASQP